MDGIAGFASRPAGRRRATRRLPSAVNPRPRGFAGTSRCAAEAAACDRGSLGHVTAVPHGGLFIWPAQARERGQNWESVDVNGFPPARTIQARAGPVSGNPCKALCRTRTDDPFLTITRQPISDDARLPIYAANTRFLVSRCSGLSALLCGLRLPKSFHRSPVPTAAPIASVRVPLNAYLTRSA
jgi:hypothetical protein